jgi:hypothetical protein
MTLPQILVDLMKLLFDIAMPAAMCTMVLAGIALRREGGANFQAGGNFQRWALWSVILLTLPQFLSWFAAQGISMPPQGGNISSPWVAGVETSFNSFVTNVVIAKLSPLLAAFCVPATSFAGHLRSALGDRKEKRRRLRLRLDLRGRRRPPTRRVIRGSTWSTWL